jgi:hypothetical protein
VGNSLWPAVYRGVVIDNEDPQGRGRVQVSVPGVLGESRLWALTLTQARDTFLPLESGDEVFVAFEAGDPDYPVVLGMLLTP